MPQTRLRRARQAIVDQDLCVACGCCMKACPRAAIQVQKGVYAVVDAALCVGCGLCAKACPASVISVGEVAV